MKISNLASLRQETERLEYKLKADISKLKTEFQLLRYQLIELAIREIAGLFKKSADKPKSEDKE
jgi:hypothetical protein